MPNADAGKSLPADGASLPRSVFYRGAGTVLRGTHPCRGFARNGISTLRQMRRIYNGSRRWNSFSITRKAALKSDNAKMHASMSQTAFPNDDGLYMCSDVPAAFFERACWQRLKAAIYTNVGHVYLAGEWKDEFDAGSILLAGSDGMLAATIAVSCTGGGRKPSAKRRSPKPRFYDDNGVAVLRDEKWPRNAKCR